MFKADTGSRFRHIPENNVPLKGSGYRQTQTRPSAYLQSIGFLVKRAQELLFVFALPGQDRNQRRLKLADGQFEYADNA
jgi:hypothetical protein